MEEPLYIRVLGRVKGPFQWDKLRALVRRGQLSRIHEVSRDGKTFVKATEYPDLFIADTVTPEPAQPTAATESAAVTSQAPAVEQSAIDNPLEEDPLQLQPAEQANDNWYYDHTGSPAGPISQAKLQQI